MYKIDKIIQVFPIAFLPMKMIPRDPVDLRFLQTMGGKNNIFITMLYETNLRGGLSFGWFKKTQKQFRTLS